MVSHFRHLLFCTSPPPLSCTLPLLSSSLVLPLFLDAEARSRLVPVMTMLLKLSPEEKQMLTSVANGEVPAAGAVMQANAAEGGGWSAYLHRWSGLM